MSRMRDGGCRRLAVEQGIRRGARAYLALRYVIRASLWLY